MKKIDFVLETLERGGGPRNIYMFSKNLNENGYSSKIMNLFNLSAIPLKAYKKRYSSIDTFGVPVATPGRSLSLFNIAMTGYIFNSPLPVGFSLAQEYTEPRALKRLAKESDVLIATLWRTVRPVQKFSIKRGKKMFYFVQADEATFSHKTRYSTLAQKTYDLRIPMFTHSRVLVDRFKAKYKVDLEYVGFGINGAQFSPIDFEPSKRIFTVARSGAHKGFGTFVHAINRLWEKRQDFEVIIAGMEGALKDQEIKFPYKFVGWISSDAELASLYRNSIFVNTGKDEALPMPPLEAMSCGAAVVASDLPGIREYAEDGKNCILVPVDNADKFSEAINTLLDSESLRKDYRDAGIKTALQYDWKTATLRLIAFIESPDKQ